MAGFLSKPQSNHTNSLSRRLESTDGVIYLTENVVEDVGYLVIEPDTSNQEIIKYTSKGSGYVSGGVRQLSTVGSAETAGTGIAHPAGSTVEMRDVHFYWARIIDALNGVSATSANQFRIGENVATASAITTGSLKGVFYTAGTSASLSTFVIGLSSNGYGVWSDDGGATFNRLSATGGAVNTGDGWENAAGVGNVVVADLISATAGISSKNDNFTVNEAFTPTWSGLHNFTADIALNGERTSADMVFGVSVRTAGSTGSQTITTGLGTWFRELDIVATNWGNGLSGISHGTAYTSATQYCIDNINYGTGIIQIVSAGSWAAVQANVSSISANGDFTINWLVNSSSLPNTFFTWKARR